MPGYCSPLRSICSQMLYHLRSTWMKTFNIFLVLNYLYCLLINTRMTIIQFNTSSYYHVPSLGVMTIIIWWHGLFKNFFHYLYKSGAFALFLLWFVCWKLSLLIPLLLWPLLQRKGTFPSAPPCISRNLGHRNQRKWHVSMYVAQSTSGFPRTYSSFF